MTDHIEFIADLRPPILMGVNVGFMHRAAHTILVKAYRLPYIPLIKTRISFI